jgi:hypothetical protein
MNRLNNNSDALRGPRVNAGEAHPVFFFVDEHQRFVTEPGELFMAEARSARGEASDAQAMPQECEQP